MRRVSSLSQKPDAKFVAFPGAVKSAFTSALRFSVPSEYPAMDTYRAVDQHGVVVDNTFTPDLSDQDIVKIYENMLLISTMDVIMFDAQRQGRISFYMVSAGEEALAIGSASVLEPQDVIFCQYREQGVFVQRGFQLEDFMNQLFANHKDPGRGRNMPVHYGSDKLNIVSKSIKTAVEIQHAAIVVLLTLQVVAHHIFASRNSTSSGVRGCVCP